MLLRPAVSLRKCSVSNTIVTADGQHTSLSHLLAIHFPQASPTFTAIVLWLVKCTSLPIPFASVMDLMCMNLCS